MTNPERSVEEIDDTPSAFEIKICEMTSAVFHRDKSPYQANKVLFKGHAKALTQAHQAGIDEAVDRIFGEIDEFKAEVISMDYCDDFKDGIYATIEHILSMPVFESVLVPPELRQDNK